MYKVILIILLASFGVMGQDLGVIDSDTLKKPKSGLTRFSEKSGKIFFRGATGTKKEVVSTNNSYENPTWIPSFALAKITGLQDSLSNTVKKIAGKSLSANDYTTTEKNKLAGIPSDAQTQIDNKKQIISSVSDLQAFSGTIADFDGSTWVKKSGNKVSNGGSYAGTIVRVSSSVYWERKTDYVTPQMFGVVADSSIISPTLLLNTINANKKGNIVFPSGVYLVNNSAGYLSISDFHGKISFEGEAKLVFSDSTKGGIEFTMCHNIVVENLSTEYANPPKLRGNYYGIHVWKSNSVIFRNITVINSLGAGLLFNECIKPSTYNIKISNTRADGLHFSNCQDPFVDGLDAYNTADDGLAFVNYASGSDYKGGYATNIKIRKSFARGIAIAGQSDVVVTNFVIDSTASSGLYIAYESFWNLRTPDNIVCLNGLITNAGKTANVGSRHGIEYSSIKTLSLCNIKVVNPFNRGLSGNGLEAKLFIRNVEIDSVLTNTGLDISALHIDMDGVSVSNIGGTGISIINSGNVVTKNLTAKNTSKLGGLNRGFWFENNTSILVDGINLIDTQPTATGFRIWETSNTYGVISNIQHYIPNGTIAYTNGSAGNVIFGSKNGIIQQSNVTNLTSDLAAKLSTSTASSTYFPFAGGTITGTTNLTGTNPLMIQQSSFQPITLRRSLNTNGSGQGIYYQALNSSSAYTTYAVINTTITSNTAGSEAGELVISTMKAGSLSEQLKVLSTGLLISRQTTAQINAIASPATGLLVFDTTLGKFAYWNGSVWKTMTTD